MIDIEAWLRELDEEEDVDIKNNEEYQTKLFEEYVLRSTNHAEERKKLNTRYRNGEPVMGEHGLRKELAAFDLSSCASEERIVSNTPPFASRVLIFSFSKIIPIPKSFNS